MSYDFLRPFDILRTIFLVQNLRPTIDAFSSYVKKLLFIKIVISDN